MFKSLKTGMILAAFMAGGIGSSACASQPQEFPPLLKGQTTQQADPDKPATDNQEQAPEQVEAQLSVREAAKAARQRRVEARWQQVRSSVDKGEVRTYAATRKSMRASSSGKDMPSQSDDLAARAQESDAPVLCPWGAVSVEETRMVSMSDSYSIKATLSDGSNMTISGTCMAADSPATRRYKGRMASKKSLMAKDKRMMKKLDAPYSHTRTEYGQEIEFSKYGCAYTLTYYCADEEEDNCLNPEELVALADDAILMNGPE